MENTNEPKTETPPAAVNAAAEAENKKPVTMADFFTRDDANKGVKLDLFNPRTGAKTAHWIQVVGVDSDEFQRAKRKAERYMYDVLAENPDKAKDEAFTENAQREMRFLQLVPVVKAWSFDEPLTAENVKKFFINAPQIMDGVDRLIGNRPRFFEQSLTASENTQKASSS